MGEKLTNFIREIRPNAAWDVIKWGLGFMLASFLALGYWFLQIFREVPPSVFVMLVIFIVSLTLTMGLFISEKIKPSKIAKEVPLKEELQSEKQPKTLNELIKDDFKKFFILTAPATVLVLDQSSGKRVGYTIESNIMADFDAKAKFLVAYIPKTVAKFTICQALAENHIEMFNMQDKVGMEGGYFNEKTNLEEMVFTERVYIYHETNLLKEQRNQIEQLFSNKKVSVILRDSQYAFEKNYRSYTYPNVSPD